MSDATNRMPSALQRLAQEFIDDRRKWLGIGTPWITEGAKSWLSRNILPTDRILEFGAGRSTIFWAKQAGKVTIVEGSPDWTLWVLMYLYTQPHLLKKVRFYFCPTEWNPNFPGGARRYWKENRASLDENDVYDLERDLVSVNFPNHNIIFYDGNIRVHVFLYQMATIDFSEVDAIVIDNCESMFTSESADLLIPPDFQRVDFVAGRLDEIPTHQKGKHITSLFVKKERLARSTPVFTAEPQTMTRQEREKHMHFLENYNTQSHVDAGYRYLNDHLGANLQPKYFTR